MVHGCHHGGVHQAAERSPRATEDAVQHRIDDRHSRSGLSDLGEHALCDIAEVNRLQAAVREGLRDGIADAVGSLFTDARQFVEAVLALREV
jgi:hypothetical protein